MLNEILIRICFYDELIVFELLLKLSLKVDFKLVLCESFDKNMVCSECFF